MAPSLPRFGLGGGVGGGPAPSDELPFGRFTIQHTAEDFSDVAAYTIVDPDNFSSNALVDPLNSSVITFPDAGLYAIHAIFTFDATLDTSGAAMIQGSWPGPNSQTVFPNSVQVTNSGVTVEALAYFPTADPTNFISAQLNLDNPATVFAFCDVEVEVTTLGVMAAPPPPPPPPPPGSGFTDLFDRSDRALDGDNGWFKSDPPNVADLAIRTNAVTVPVGAAIEFGFSPMLHPRNDSNPAFADVSCTVARVDATGFSGLAVVGDDTWQFGLMVEFDATIGPASLDIITGGAGGPSTWDTDHGTWHAFASATIRLTYDAATTVFSVFLDGVLAYDVNVQAALDTFFGPGVVTFPALAALPNAGIMSNAAAVIDSFTDFVCV